MSLTKLFMLPLLACALSAHAQTTHYGDTARARIAMHHPEATLRNWRAQLGYIDTIYATRQQFLDNLEVGLRIAGPHKEQVPVTEFSISFLPKGGDYVLGKKITGNKMPVAEYNRLNLASVKAGDRIFFEGVKAEENHAVRAVNAVVISIK